MSPRKPTFSEDTVIDAAIESFTLRGYSGADAVALCSDVGIARSSLYNTFGSRDALFVRALGEYSRRGQEEAAGLAVAPGPALLRLRHRLLDQVLAQAADHGRAGCLSVNTAAELGRSIDEVAAILDADRGAWIRTYSALLRQAVQDGDVMDAEDQDERAALLHTLLGGLRVAARVLDAGALSAQVDALLGSWATAAGRVRLSEPGRGKA